MEMGVGSALSAPVTLGCGSPAPGPAPRLAGTLSTDGVLRRGTTVSGEPLGQCRARGPHVFCLPSPLRYCKEERRREMVLCFGRTFLPKWKLHFWLCPLLSLWWKAVHSASGPSRSGLARRDWVLFVPVSGKPHHPGLLSKAGFGGWLPSLSRGSAPRAPILESSLTSSGLAVQAAVPGSHPFPLQFARKPRWWVPRYRQAPRRHAPCPRHCCCPGEVGGKDLTPEIPLKDETTIIRNIWG